MKKVIFGVLVLALAIGIPAYIIAQGKEADVVEPEKILDTAKNTYTDTIAPQAKNIFGKTYNAVESFRADTAEKLKTMWMEKAETADRLQDEQNRAVDEHADRVARGEGDVGELLVEGAAGRARWGIFGAKASKAGLSVLLFAFENPTVFYGAIILVIVSLVYWIISTIRRPSYE